MSRRHGRGHHHERPRHEAPKPGTSTETRAVRAAEPGPALMNGGTHPQNGGAHSQPAPVGYQPAPAPRVDQPPPPDRAAPPVEFTAPRPETDRPSATSNDRPNGAPATADGMRHQNGHDRGAPCTAPQLRRFIKSRPYVPMHELRRRFAIDGGDDDVSPIEIALGRIYVGLPDREGQLLGELVRAGEIGYELSLDPRTPIVVGVYPMRPVPRP